jgi:hypothetical protein
MTNVLTACSAAAARAKSRTTTALRPWIDPMQTYLADGLYAEFDGEQFRLYTERENGVHEVYLDPTTLQAFLAFVERVKRERAV